MTANTAAIHTDRIMQCNHMHTCVVIRSYVATLCITMCYVCIYKDLSTSLASYLCLPQSLLSKYTTRYNDNILI